MESSTGLPEDNCVWEIEEEELGGVAVPSPPRVVADGDEVYVAVGNTRSSMGALSWALKHIATPSSLVYLVHVFPEVHNIPTPLGMIPKHQLSSHQVETYMNQERNKRRQLLQKFMNLCQSSKVQVDTLLIENDLIAKAVTELISVLNIQRLIVGTTKSNIRKLRGSGKAEQIQKIAPQHCEIKIIYDGKEAIGGQAMSSPLSVDIVGKNNGIIERQKNKDTVSCHCFSRKHQKGE